MKKTCSICHKEYPLTYFSLVRRGEPGRRNQCRLCKAQRQRLVRSGAIIPGDTEPVYVRPADAVPPRTMNIWELPVYVPPPWRTR